MRAYGTLEYERAAAITLVEAVAELGGLMEGGEQFPNSLAAVDQGGRLKKAVARDTEGTDEEKAAALALAEGLIEIWTKGLHEDDGRNGVTIPRLVGLADAAMVSGVPAWTP